MPRINHIFMVLLTGLMMSFYFHPTELRALPGYNTKIMLAVFGVAMLIYNIIRTKDYSLSKGLLYSFMIAGAFSFVNYISLIINESDDYSYANYPISALTWIMGAYGAISFIRWTHSKVTVELVVRYLAGGAAFHCILSQLIDRDDSIRNFVTSIFYIADSMEEMQRLYSFGVGLDPSGVRFAVILVLIAGVLTLSKIVKKNIGLMIFYFLCFAIISVLGNIISRTTTVGMGLGLFVFAISTGLYKFVIKVSRIKIMRVFGIMLAIGIPIVVYYYNVNPSFQDQIEYGFEGFFSLFESGEFQTSSTDELSTMWVWPQDTQTWLIGSGLFLSKSSDFTYFSDIGYCRFIFYSGLIGFTVFGLYFVYNAIHFATRYPRYRYIFFLMIVVTFVVWSKVATDIFQLYALFYAFTDEEELYASLDEEEDTKQLEPIEEESNPALMPQA
ncbi:MAG: hypothetical protein HXN24_01655 [Porphyromonas sp.]|nr:hypothetical protein [Porphyromonas sp.]